MRGVLELIRRVAPSNATVLLLGESGVGKELAARAIHDNSHRGERAFIAVNCAALPETLLESELFGHEAGAFTGATGRRMGRFELADGGTIFLDEIGEIAPAIQVKLLRVLQEKEFVRVGGTRTIGCDVRVIAASNRDLQAEKDAGRFRDDLYYRLNVFPIVIPPLRERREDIPGLAEHFLDRLAGDMKIPRPRIAEPAMQALGNYLYPGNIRELQNVLERGCLLADEGLIEPRHLPAEIAGTAPIAPQPAPGGAATSALASMEKKLILQALQDNDWNQSRAARSLGISRDNLRYRIKKYGINIPR
jgi:transcriptional regulator with GAF, ATPase, and Fis domain